MIVATVPVNAVRGAVTGGTGVVVGASVVVVVVEGAGAVVVAARVVDVVDDLD